MNIGICIQHTGEGLRENFRAAAEHGFRHCQLISWNDALWTDDEAARVRELTEEFGISVTAFWCGWSGPKKWNFTDGPETLGLAPVTYRAQRMNDLIRGAAFAKKIGVTDVVTHMGFVPENMTDPNYPGFRAAVAEVASQYRKMGQNLLFETGQETPVTLLRLFEDVGTGNLYVNLDPANLLMYGKGNPVDAVDMLGDYVRGVHIKDGLYPVNGRELGLETKVGCGKVDFKALIAALKAHGYDGSLTIEREISGEKRLADILDARWHIESILEEM